MVNCPKANPFIIIIFKFSANATSAPIEQLTEFNVANYLRDLPCGLSVGQAAHEIPKYRSGLIRAVRRTREKETNYVERQTSSDSDQTTTAKCELYVEKEPIAAVIDSGT